jgi:cytochrome c biogenesis protein CcdA
MLQGLVYLVVYLLIVGIVIWLLIYLIDMIPLPEPFNRVAKVVIMVIGVLIVITLLLGVVGDVPRLKF